MNKPVSSCIQEVRKIQAVSSVTPTLCIQTSIKGNKGGPRGEGGNRLKGAAGRRKSSVQITSEKPQSVRYLDGRNFTRSPWKSTFSSFLHLVFLTRADLRFAVSPLSSKVFLRFTPFLDLSPPETSPSQRMTIKPLHNGRKEPIGLPLLQPPTLTSFFNMQS